MRDGVETPTLSPGYGEKGWAARWKGGVSMKLGDGRKVTMLKIPPCAERNRLHAEASELWAECLACRDEVRVTPRNDPSYARKVKEMKDAQKKYEAAESRRSQHTHTHGCW
jgi:hypothetical protein